MINIVHVTEVTLTEQVVDIITGKKNQMDKLFVEIVKNIVQNYFLIIVIMLVVVITVVMSV